MGWEKRGIGEGKAHRGMPQVFKQVCYVCYWIRNTRRMNKTQILMSRTIHKNIDNKAAGIERKGIRIGREMPKEERELIIDVSQKKSIRFTGIGAVKEGLVVSK